MTHSQKLTIVAILAATGGGARAQVTVSLDLLDGVDPGGPVPAGLIVVDVFADVAATDVWTAAGLRATAENGAALMYEASNVILNPGLEDPFDFEPFVTCVSKPLERDGAARFFNAGAAIAGRYDPSGLTPTVTASEVNVAWFASPPATVSSPSVDGYIARLVIDVSGVDGIDASTITVAKGTPPADSIPLLVSRPVSQSFGTALATFDVPALSGTNWSVHAFRPFTDPTLLRYSFSDSTALPAILDDGPDGNDATAGPEAALVAEVPPAGPASGGNRSLDCRVNGAVTNGTLLLSNDAVEFGGGFTMEAWFKWNGGGTVNSIIDYAGTEKLVIDVREVGTPAVTLRMSDGTDYPVGPAAPGQWQYVAAVFQASSRDLDGTIAGTVTTYLDSVSSPTVTQNAFKTAFGDSLVRGIAIGQHPTGLPLDFFDGLIHEPRVNLRALTPSQLLLGIANARFRRGDPNGDGSVDIADALSILSFLFGTGAPSVCDDAADANDDAEVNISDALSILGYLFLGSTTPPSPGPETCGTDPTPDTLDRCSDPAGACG